ncbi:glycosyltransferase [Haloplanus ruber]|uniref:Glycosyltransferase n=1 Tax=Haloplanus ruber TaxID=869892 RepID=A0ABD6CXJ2_9EURY|nr:glycosyltransferase [Haloplanus ruber]
MATSDGVVLFTPTLSGAGGVERYAVNLSNGLSKNKQVTVLTPEGASQGPLVSDISQTVAVQELSKGMSLGPGVLATVPALCEYINEQNPGTMISAMRHANLSVLLAAKFSYQSPKTILTFHNNASRLTQKRDLFRRIRSRAIYRGIKHSIDSNTDLIGVSKGVSKSVADQLGCSQDRVSTIYNPVVTEELLNTDFPPPDHAWLSSSREMPVILAAKPQPQKNLSLLLESVTQLEREVRIIIVGQGNEENKLKKKANRLNISDNVDIIGLVEDIYPYLYHTDVFALTSSWEGLSYILIEAMACGTQVVSTDCPSGPSEVLLDGEIGYLVEEDNPTAVAEGLKSALADPYEPRLLKERARKFSTNAAAEQYISIL